MFKWRQYPRNLAKWCETWNKKMCLSLSFSRHGASQYWCPEALQIRMASICFGYYFHVGKMEKKNNSDSLQPQSCCLPAVETVHSRALLKVSMHIFYWYVPAILSWTYVLDILTQVPKGTHTRFHCGFACGAREVGDKVGVEVQNVVVAHPQGPTADGAMDQVYCSWQHRWIPKPQSWVKKVQNKDCNIIQPRVN